MVVNHNGNPLRLSTVFLFKTSAFLGSGGGRLLGRPAGRVRTVPLNAQSLYEVGITVLVSLDAAGSDQSMDPLARDPKEPSRFCDAEE